MRQSMRIGIALGPGIRRHLVQSRVGLAERRRGSGEAFEERLELWQPPPHGVGDRGGQPRVDGVDPSEGHRRAQVDRDAEKVVLDRLAQPVPPELHRQLEPDRA